MECGICNMCCFIPEVKKLDKKLNVWCEFCIPGSSKGCKIYSVRPDECSGFKCAYVQMEKADVELRPDNSKVMFEKITDTIFLGSLHEHYDLNNIIKRQIEYFLNDGFSVVIVSPKFKKMKIYAAKNVKEKDVYLSLKEKVK